MPTNAELSLTISEFARRLSQFERDLRDLRDTSRGQVGTTQALEEQVRALQASLRDVEASQKTDTERLLEAIEQIPSHTPLGAQLQHKQQGSQIWESKNGRRVLGWGFVSAVLCCLAIGGGLTSEEFFRYLSPFAVDARSGATQVTPPAPQHKPAPTR